MYFNVTYRQADGKRISEVFEASSRNDVFPLISAKGIHAISVVECKSPKITQRKQVSAAKFKPSSTLLVVFLLATIGAVAWLLLSEAESECDSRQTHGKLEGVASRRPTKKVNPLANPRDRPQVEDLKALYPTNAAATVERRDGIPAPVPLDRQAVKNHAGEKRIFKTAAEQLLSMAFSDDPTQDTPPLPIDETNDLSDEELDKGLSTIIAVEETDDEATLARKAAVIELKNEFEQLRKEEGWTFAKYVLELQHRNRMNAEFYSEVCKVNEMAYHDAALTDKEYESMRAELNAKLAERGLPAMPTADEDQDAEDAVRNEK